MRVYVVLSVSFVSFAATSDCGRKRATITYAIYSAIIYEYENLELHTKQSSTIIIISGSRSSRSPHTIANMLPSCDRGSYSFASHLILF